MRIRNLTVSNSRLTEGSYHIFQILKIISLGTDDTYFVMQDPLGYKVLMPAGYYTKYGFEAGRKIECRVDRINCNGRMFIEPMHPIYKEGEVYEFAIVGSGTRKNITGDDEHYIMVRDALQLEWMVRIFSDKQVHPAAQTIKCRLDRIKKGKLFLSPESDNPNVEGLETGKTYPFLIKEEKINPVDGLRYFILEDEVGRKHLLKKKYYIHYGLKPGQQVKCRVDKFTSEGFFFLEPQNPWYKTGEVYDFKTLEIHKLNFSDGTVEDVLVLDDPHGDDIKLFINNVESVKDKKQVTCRVTNIRKSRLELAII